ncbi:MAG: GlcNAc-transferase family protein [bacterium]
MKTIFVQIASYRDTELPFTIKNCLEKARYPDRLRFGICLQYDDATTTDLDEYLDDARFSIDRVHFSESKGCCWARNRTNNLYQDEDYTLQIDAHMRFEENWDDRLLVMVGTIKHDKPLLTTYPPPYVLIDGQAVLQGRDEIQKLRLARHRLDLTTQQEGCKAEATGRPGKSELVAAGYLFTVGQFCEEVQYDPDIYFQGEEISLAARAYTHGYNFYYPSENLVWHRYNHDSPLHWGDHGEESQIKHRVALQRLEYLLLGEHHRLGRYGLGDARTLQDFEQYAGLSFSDVIERRNRTANPELFQRTLRLNTHAIAPREDYECWVFCLLDEEDQELYRLDISDPDILSHRTNTIYISEVLDGVPDKYMLWPKTPDGWGSKTFYPIEPVKEDKEMTTVEENAPKIFVALAAYREPELELTISDCIAKAANPARLRFGVCLQYDNEGIESVHEDCIDHLLDSTIRIVKYPYSSSKGGCWARNKVQSLYRDEEFTLQVDSHSRFVKGWDELLIGMMHDFPSRRPLITGFPPLYFINNGVEEFTSADDLSRVPTTRVESWSEDGWIHHPTEFVSGNDVVPRRTRVLSGAFVFTLGRWNYDVNQDPDHLYSGEEFALTLRSYTSGYDLFNPSQIVVWHRNHPEPNHKYITDFDRDSVGMRHLKAVNRLQVLLRGDPDNELGSFGLGNQRTLDDYRIYSGLDCTHYTIHKNARRGVPPDPVTLPDEYNPEVVTHEVPASEMIDVSIQLTGQAELLELRCEAASPVLPDLVAAVEANTCRQTGDADPLMYLQFDHDDHEIYFLQSQVMSVQTRTPGEI